MALSQLLPGRASLCPPRMSPSILLPRKSLLYVPICLAALQSTVSYPCVPPKMSISALLSGKAPLRGPSVSPGQWLWGIPVEIDPIPPCPASCSAPPLPGTGKNESGWRGCREEAESGAVGLLGCPEWVHPRVWGLHPGLAEGGCVEPRLRVGAAGCWGSIRHVPLMSLCHWRVPWPPWAGPHRVY